MSNKKKYLDHVLKKTAFNLDTLRTIAKTAPVIGASVAVPFLAANSWRNKIQNDTRRKALIEDLYSTDPIIKNADRDDVIEYYSTIFSVAPSISLDKNVVRELLQNFIKFGRVDIQTIKTLADTEKSMKQSKPDMFNVKDALNMAMSSSKFIDAKKPKDGTGGPNGQRGYAQNQSSNDNKRFYY
jgi:hypothetical protein